VFFDDGQAQFAKENLTELFGGIQIERLFCQFVGVLFQLQQAFADFIRLSVEQVFIDQDAVAFYLLQDDRSR
jgi:hypothetical protein